MYDLKRFDENPFLLPGNEEDWDACAAFNPCVIKDKDNYHLLYRAQSRQQKVQEMTMSVSSIGYARGVDGIHFSERRQLIKPEEGWERFGCEDPRITKLGGKYYIFYTALSIYPFEANGIRIGLAISDDLNKIKEKHAVTPFNSKAMALFPEKINDKFVAILTVHTDLPPAKIALAVFDREEQIWSEEYWEDWYASLNIHTIPLLRSSNDHLEVGAPPVKTDKGWLLIYSYINDYFSSDRTFNIETVLLDLKDPLKVVGRINESLLIPEKDYELKGDISNVVFPSGALVHKKNLQVYYGATDMTCCAAYAPLDQILKKMDHKKSSRFISSKSVKQGFKRYVNNPIITPRAEFSWEAKATFNPAALYLGGKFHLVYRAMSYENTSVMGYASSRDGINFDERLHTPIYEPREDFELALRPGNSGCEDPRLTIMGDSIYMFYAAFDGYTPRVAFSSILIDDFLNKRWLWKKAMVITPPGIDDKDACLLSRTFNEKYVLFHRVGKRICINFVDELKFDKNNWLIRTEDIITPRKPYWDNKKFGIASPPIETRHGWLLFFHRITLPGDIYKIEALLLDLNDPTQVIAETDATLLEPEMDCEKYGQVPNVVFPCGSILHQEEIFLYYGGADKVVCVAKMKLSDIFKRLGI